MTLYFGRHPDDHAEISANVTDWEAAAGMMAMIVLVAANGPDGFDEEDLDAALIGASPAETVLMVMGSVGRLVKRAWPDIDW